MIGVGDAIAFTGVCGVAITAIAKWGGGRLPKTNGYVRQTTCKAVHDGTNMQLKDIKDDIGALFDQYRDLNEYIRSK